MSKFLVSILLLCFTGLAPQTSFAFTRKILSAKTSTGAGATYQLGSGSALVGVQAYGLTGSGAGACDVILQVSNDNTNWNDLGMISLTLGTSSSSDVLEIGSPWQYYRANVLNISGTGAACSMILSY